MEGMQQLIRSKYEGLQDFCIAMILRFWYLSLASITITAAILTVGFNKLDTDDDIQLAVSPSNSQAIDDRDVFDDHYPDFPTIQQFLILAVDDSILTLDAYLEIQQFDQELKTLVKTSGKNWEDLCYRVLPGVPCFQPAHALLFWESAPGAFDLSGMTSDQDIIDRINGGVSYANLPVDFTAMFSDPEPSNYLQPGNTNILTKATGVLYPLQTTGDDDELNTVKDYEVEIEDFCSDFRDRAKFIKPYALTEHAAQRAGSDVIKENLTTIIIVANTLIVFLFLVLNIRFSPMNSHLFLAFSTLFLCITGYQEGIGICGWVNAPNTATASAVSTFFFLMFSITHFFYIMPVFDAKSDLEPKERVRETYRVIGAPLMVSNILHTLTFAMISTIGMERMRDVASNGAVVFAFITLNYAVVFPVMLYIEATRQARGKGDFFGAFFCREDAPVCCNGSLYYNKKGRALQPVKTFYRKKVLKALRLLPVKIVVVVMFVAYLAVNIAYVSGLYFDYQVDQLFTSDMEVDKSFDVMMDHFKEYGSIAVVMTDNADIKQESVQLEYSQYITDVRRCKDCGEDWTVNGGDFWVYEFFQYWMTLGRCQSERGIVTLTAQGTIPEEYFVSCLNQMLAYDGLPLNVFVEWNEDRSVIESFFANVRIDLFDREDTFEGMNDLRDLVADNGPGDSIIYTPPMITYEFFLHITEITTVHIIVLFGITVIFSAMFLQSLLQSLIIGFFIICSTLAALATIIYADVAFSPFAEFYAATLLPEAATFYLYFFAYLNHETGSPRLNLKRTTSSIAFPTIAKTLIQIGGTIGLSVSSKIYEHAPMFYSHIIINAFSILFLLPVICYYIYPNPSNIKETEMPEVVKAEDNDEKTSQKDSKRHQKIKRTNRDSDPETATLEANHVKVEVSGD